MTKLKWGRSFGGRSVEDDPFWGERLAHRLRKTEQAQRKKRRAHERFAAEMAAYRSRPKFELIKAQAAPDVAEKPRWRVVRGPDGVMATEPIGWPSNTSAR